MTINCNINGKTIEILSNNQENIILNPNEVALIEHKNESYIEKKWTGLIKHINIGFKIHYNDAIEKNIHIIEILQKEIEPNEVEQVFYSIIYPNIESANVDYYFQDDEKIKKTILKRENIHYICDLLIYPIIYFLLDRIILNKFWYWLLDKISSKEIYNTFLIISYVFVFVINGIVQTIGYFGVEKKKIKQEICEIFNKQIVYDNFGVTEETGDGSVSPR